MSLLEVLGGDADRTGNRVRHRLHIERRAEIDDERRFGAVEPGFELLRRHSRDPQAAQQALALDPLEDHVCSDDGGKRPAKALPTCSACALTRSNALPAA